MHILFCVNKSKFGTKCFVKREQFVLPFISILYTKVEFTYNQLMAKLFRLPKFIQMEIGKALIANASEEFEKEE